MTPLRGDGVESNPGGSCLALGGIIPSRCTTFVSHNLEIVRTINSLCQSCGFRFLYFQQSSLVVAYMQSKPFSTLQHGESYSPVFFSKRKAPTVISCTRRGKLLNQIALLLSRLTVGTNAPNGMNGQLRRQTRMCFRSHVDQRL